MKWVSCNSASADFTSTAEVTSEMGQRQQAQKRIDKNRSLVVASVGVELIVSGSFEYDPYFIA